MLFSAKALLMRVKKLAIPPDWNNPIVLSRPGVSKKLVGVFLGKRLDRQSPFALIMLIVLAGLFLAGAVLVVTEFWYLGVACLATMICLFLFLPVSRRRHLKDSS